MPIGWGLPMCGGKGGGSGTLCKIGVVWHFLANMGTPQRLVGPTFAQRPTVSALVLVFAFDKGGHRAAAFALNSLYSSWPNRQLLYSASSL